MNQLLFYKKNNGISSFLTRNADLIYMHITKDTKVKSLYKSLEDAVKKLETNIRKAIWNPLGNR